MTHDALSTWLELRLFYENVTNSVHLMTPHSVKKIQKSHSFFHSAPFLKSIIIIEK